jgi:uncharacterized protein (TIGR00369 family)
MKLVSECIMERDNHCFGCGPDNPAGLRLTFESSPDGTVRSTCTIPERFQGYQDVVHGGILATLLDEVMAHAVLRATEGNAATAQLEIRYRRPARVGETLRLEASVSRASGRRIHAKGRICGEDGAVRAEGEALFLRVEGVTSR